MQLQKYYWIYILEVINGKYYTGYTCDIVRRYKEHKRGTANSKFTRAFKTKKLLQAWKIKEEIGVVMKIEILIKKQSRKMKIMLIEEPALLRKLVKTKLDFPVKINKVNFADINKINFS